MRAALAAVITTFVGVVGFPFLFSWYLRFRQKKDQA